MDNLQGTPEKAGPTPEEVEKEPAPKAPEAGLEKKETPSERPKDSQETSSEKSEASQRSEVPQKTTTTPETVSPSESVGEDKETALDRRYAKEVEVATSSKRGDPSAQTEEVHRLSMGYQKEAFGRERKKAA